MINCKEVIITPNDDSTYKVECVGCKFVNNGEEVEGKIVFPKLTKTEVDAINDTKNKIYEFTTAATDEEPEIFTICIPD